METKKEYHSTHFKGILQEEFLSRIKRNPKYSLRAFAKNLGISHSALAEMLNGKRTITAKSVEKLAPHLGLESLEIVKMHNSDDEYVQIELDQFALISDWHHYAILELIKIPGIEHSAKCIAKALSISKTEVEIALERMLRLKILIHKDNCYTELSGGNATNIHQNLTSIGSKNLQKQILNQSIDALTNIPLEKRNHTSMTMAIDSNLIAKANEKIKTFRRELADFLETSGVNNEVYQLSISLFPITNLQEKNND